MMHHKKILALAVGSAFAGSAMAAVTAINLDSSAAQGANLASEVTLPQNVPQDYAVNGQVGWGFSAGTAVYVRYDLGNSATFAANPTSLAANEPTGAATTGATTTLSTGGSGSSFVIYQVTANSSGSNTTANLALVLPGNSVKATTAGSVSLTQTVYDTAANAVAGSTTGRLVTAKTATLVNFLPSYTFTVTAGTAQTADASATAGIYKGFTGGLSVGTVALGTLNNANAGTTPLSNSGGASTANTVVGSGTLIRVVGDFTASANANGTFTGAALSKVFLSNQGCSGTAAINANSLTSTTATFALNSAVISTAVTTAGNNTLCITAEGNTAIPAATYTAQYIPVAATGYTVSSSTATTIGSITRNGGQLTTPWFSTASGYISRFVLTNTGSTAAAYTVAVVTESGNTATTVPAGLSGSIPAGGMVVVNASDIVSSFSGSSRGALTFTFQTGRANVNGVYQVTSPTGGVMSTTLVSPGTN